MIKTFYKNHKETINNFFWRGLQIFGKQGITFLTFIICAKLLSPYDFGIYNYLLAIIFFVIIFSDFGISQSTSKFVAEYNNKNSDKVKNILFNSLLVIFFMSFITIIIFIVISYFFFKEYLKFLWYLLPLIFLSPISSVYDGVYRGLKKFKRLSFITTMVGLLSIVYIYLFIYYLGIKGALISQSIFYFILSIALFIGYKEINFGVDKAFLSKIIKYGIIIGFTSIFYYFYTRVDIIILGQFGYFKEIGYYEVVNKIYEIIKIPFFILATVIAPNITYYYSKGDFANVKKKFLKHLYIFSIIGIFSTIFFYLFFPVFINIFLKEYFTKETLYIFNILLVILPFRIVGTIISQAYTISTGNAHLSLWTMMIAGVLNIILDIVFIDYYGFIGVVYSTIICFSFAIISFTILYFLKLNKLCKKL